VSKSGASQARTDSLHEDRRRQEERVPIGPQFRREEVRFAQSRAVLAFGRVLLRGMASDACTFR
jgi:hypothetical protein